jgi:hypothetical protein
VSCHRALPFIVYCSCGGVGVQFCYLEFAAVVTASSQPLVCLAREVNSIGAILNTAMTKIRSHTRERC